MCLCVGAYWEYKLSLATGLVGAEDKGPQQPLSGLSHLARCILRNSNLFKIQPLQFAARTWQYFHSTVVLPESRQKEEKQDLAFLLMQKLFSTSLFLVKRMLSCLCILLKAARSMPGSHLVFFPLCRSLSRALA